LLIRSDIIQGCAGCQRLFLPVLRTRNLHQFSRTEAVVKNYFQLFFAANGVGLTKSAGERIA
jgi:hypothetical protein